MTELNIIPIEKTDPVDNLLIICISRQEGDILWDEWKIPYMDYGLTFDSSESEILERFKGAIEEKFGISIKDNSEWLYKTRKVLVSQTIYLIPNSTAGEK